MPTPEEKIENTQKALKATLWCFKQYGISNTTIDMVANKVGLTTRTLRNHFGTKENCYLAAFSYFENDIADSIEKKLNKINNENSTGYEMVRNYFIADYEFFKENYLENMVLNEIELYFSRNKQVGEKYATEHLKNVGRHYEYMTKAIKKGIQDRSIRNDIVPLHTASSILTMYWGGEERVARFMNYDYNLAVNNMHCEKRVDFIIEMVMEYLKNKG